jgi:signal peptidase I
VEQPAQKEIKKDIYHLKEIFGFIKKLSWFVSAFIALIAFFLLKKFFFDIVRINSNDMRPAYSYGDAVLIKKKFNSFKANDVVYFRYPVKDSEHYGTYMCQRLVAMPGDTFELSGKDVFVNGVRQESDSSSLKFNYIIKTRHVKLDTLFKQRYNLVEGGLISDEFDYSYALTEKESVILRKDSAVKSAEMKTEGKDIFDENCFPNSVNYAWNMYHYGKIYIPQENDILRLDEKSVALYKTIITDYEDNSLEVRGDSILINGVPSKAYIVKQNYYFVLGDNRHNTSDSRRWGFLPEQNIRGKVLFRIRKS